MPNCTVIASGNIKNPKKVEAYKAAAGPAMKRYNAIVPPESFSVTHVFAGLAQPTFMLKIVFPDKVQAQAIVAFNDSEYLAIISTRDEGFGDLSIYIAE